MSSLSLSLSLSSFFEFEFSEDDCNSEGMHFSYVSQCFSFSLLSDANPNQSSRFFHPGRNPSAAIGEIFTLLKKLHQQSQILKRKRPVWFDAHMLVSVAGPRVSDHSRPELDPSGKPSLSLKSKEKEIYWGRDQVLNVADTESIDAFLTRLGSRRSRGLVLPPVNRESPDAIQLSVYFLPRMLNKLLVTCSGLQRLPFLPSLRTTEE